MNAGAAEPPGAALCGEIIELVRQATSEDVAWAAGLGPDTRLDGDLLMDSLEVAALAASLRDRYNGGFDLVAYVGTLDVDGIIDLTIADVARHVSARS